VLATILLAVTAFASTNVDDAVLLLAFFADPSIGARNVVVGQYLGMAALTATAIVLALLTWTIPGRYVGLLGLLPLLIGLARLLRLRRADDADDDEVRGDRGAGALAAILTVASGTIADGGDNVAVFVPLFAHSPAARTLLICLVFAVLVAVWCLAVRWLLNHPPIGALARRWGRRATPFVLIGLGLYILVASGSASLLRFWLRS
jgi:cadmium resistance protein CadD (predicted permease)